MRGACLCAGVRFELSGELPQLYQCHCSLCRKISGSSANAAMIVERDQLTWLGGEDDIGKYVSESGFKSHFCTNCGSPLPNITRDGNAWWVPVGLLEDQPGLSVGAHLYAASAAAWDRIPHDVRQFDEMPAAAELDALLRRNSSAS